MSVYLKNRSCRCLRCRTRALLWGAVLVTLGVLFLLENFEIVDFERSWPVLLIVIGLAIVVARTASMEGHIQPFGRAVNPPPEIPAPNVSAPRDPQVKS